MLLVYGTKCRVLFHNIPPVFSLFLMFCVLTACFGTNNSGADENTVSLDKISWCNNQTTMVFMDDGAQTTPTASVQGNTTNTPGPGPATGTPVALKDWNTLKAQLGFTVFLPTGLPARSCLLSASGSVRNVVSGSNFTLTYLLPDQTSLTIAQAAQRDKNIPFQCSTMPDISSSGSDSAIQVHGTPTAGVQLCTGTREQTNITFSANWNKQKLQQFFQDLQPNENWIPHA